jgi:signal recognition particle receptor subunit beta
MAFLDADRDQVVIRIVYDGPPLAGKTSSLVALTRLLAQRRRSEIYTPQQAEGRTLYFDWMDYLGGWIDGHQVRCQIVSVPGQRALAGRRRLLLRDADVVVFVVESTSEGAAVARASLQETQLWLARAGEPRVPIVVQANKQDLEQAIGLDALREQLPDDPNLAILAASARDGRGIREVFSFAVRLALDRTRLLIKEGRLALQDTMLDSGEALLRWLEAEEGVQPARGAPGWTQSLPSEPQTARTAGAAGLASAPGPRLPTAAVPSGLVWPPMTGRIVLQQLEPSACSVERRSGGRWLGKAAGRWWLCSAPDAEFAHMEDGRGRLLAAARRHASLATFLSEHRALALAETGCGTWRLWHVVRAELSLADALREALVEPDPERAADGILRSAERLVRVAAQFHDGNAALPATPRALSAAGARPFIGFVPDERAPRAPAAEAASGLVRRELGPWLGRFANEGAADVTRVLARWLRVVRHDPSRSALVEALTATLIGS